MNVEKLGHTAYRILKYKRRPTSNRTEDGESQKMLTSPQYVSKASGKLDALVVQGREVSAQFTQADRKESLRSSLI